MKTIFITLFAFIPQILLAGAFGTRGGGDLFSKEFFTILENQWRFLSLSQDSKLTYLNQQWNQANFVVRFTEEPLFVENQPVQAINDRSAGLILVSLKVWKSLSLVQKEELTNHEVLSILGYEDNDYHYSQTVKKNIDSIKNSPILHWKKKLQITVKEGLQPKFYFSRNGIFTVRQKSTEELFCHANLKLTKKTMMSLTEVTTKKEFYFAPDISYQGNTITLSFSSRNGTDYLQVVCTNSSQNPAGLTSPEDFTLERILDTLEPILKTSSRP